MVKSVIFPNFYLKEQVTIKQKSQSFQLKQNFGVQFENEVLISPDTILKLTPNNQTILPSQPDIFGCYLLKNCVSD